MLLLMVPSSAADVENCIPGLDPGCSERPRASPVLCAKEGEYRSVSADEAVGVSFQNSAGKPIVIYWIDPSGHRKYYDTLQHGDSRSYHTYVTHPWIITDTANNCLMLYLPNSSPSQFIKVESLANSR
jgi:hypothetical protein